MKLRFNPLASFLVFWSITAAAQTSVVPIGGWLGVWGWVEPLHLPAPELSVTSNPGNLRLSWPATFSNFVVQTTSDLAPETVWSSLDATPTIAEQEAVLPLPASDSHRFFRLKGPYRATIPVFEFAIFYNSALEFIWTAPMTIKGRVHANGPIYVGSSTAVTFNDTVTTTERISSPNLFGKTDSQYTGVVSFNGVPPSITNTPALPILADPSGTPDALREILVQPPPGEDPESPLGHARYYNKAKVVLLVSNSTATLVLKTSPADPNPRVLNAAYGLTNFSGIRTNFPWLSLSNISFVDQSEAGKSVLPTQIDVGKLKGWLVTNDAVNAKFPNSSGVYYSVCPSIMYVADNRGLLSNQLAAVRLMNCSIVPTNMSPSGQPAGFTLATINPLYVWGDYNCPDPSALGTTNTAMTFPCSLVADSLTILSANWNDILSAGPYSVRDPQDTTINAAILAGIVQTTGSDVMSYSGGLQNLPRLLEDWQGGGKTLTLNTSFVSLFSSARATNQFQQPGVYYSAPVRHFSFDANFLDEAKLPPGTPTVEIAVPANWVRPR